MAAAPLSPVRRAVFGAVTAGLGEVLGRGVLELGARAVMDTR